MTMKHLFLNTSAALFMLVPSSILADEKPIQSKLVGLSANVALEKEDEELKMLLNHSSNSSIKLTFMVKHANIVQIMEKSVTTKDSEGWKCGSFPRISESGNAATFVIEKDGDFLGKLNDTKIEGTIEIQTGTTLVPKSFSLLAFDEPFRMDDFVFTLQEGRLKVDGNHKLIKEISVEYNDKIIDTRGSSWSNDSRTYNFEGIGKGAKITFSYWDGLVTRKVHFSKQ